MATLYNNSVKRYEFEDGIIPQNFFENNTEITSIEMSDDIVQIGQFAFHGCSALTSITLGDGVGIISTSAFNGCSSLETFSTKNVYHIGQNAFYGCSALTKIYIGSKVENIGSGAFYACTSLSSIVAYPSVAPTIQANTFRLGGSGETATQGVLKHMTSGATGYDVWLHGPDNPTHEKRPYYLGYYNWTFE